MLDFSLSVLVILAIIVVTALILVKLYRHGVKSWVVHTALVLSALFYIAFQPFEITEDIFDVYLIILVTSIFVPENPVSKKDFSNDAEESDDDSSHSGSLSDSLLSLVLLYGIFDYFDDDTDDF